MPTLKSWVAWVPVVSVAVPTAVVSLVLTVAIRRHKGSKFRDVNALKQLQVPAESLFRIFQKHLVPIPKLHSEGYAPELALVQSMLGVQPTAVMVLSIWKPALESYLLYVPNCFNMPQLVLPGYGKLRDLVLLASFVASRSNQCAYCATHCCVLAMRRGIDPEWLRRAMGKDSLDTFSSLEEAVIRVASGLGSVPPRLEKKDADLLRAGLSEAEVEWIVAAIAMFGAFNKSMDALDLPLEQSLVTETLPHMDEKFVLNSVVGADREEGKGATSIPLPPVDDWTFPLFVMYQGLRPGGALAMDSKRLRDIPLQRDSCIRYLQDKGFGEFPVLGRLRHDRFRRALTAILVKNFSSDGISLRTKLLVGIELAKVLKNGQLQSELEAVLANLPNEDSGDRNTEEPTKLILRVGLALSYTPSRMTSTLVDEIAGSELQASGIVELISFLSIVQTLHRLETFYQFGDIH